MLTLKVFIANYQIMGIINKKNFPFKKHKNLSVKNSDMQKVETDFLRAIKDYGENEEKQKIKMIFLAS